LAVVFHSSNIPRASQSSGCTPGDNEEKNDDIHLYIILCIPLQGTPKDLHMFVISISSKDGPKAKSLVCKPGVFVDLPAPLSVKLETGGCFAKSQELQLQLLPHPNQAFPEGRGPKEQH
jgi:hypothetical protein